MKSIIIIITATIFSFGVGCSQVESLNSDSSDGNSETIIELQDQVNQLQKENTLLMEKYEELENKLNNYNDHRLAMMISIAQMKENHLIDYPKCINISFPYFS